MYQETKTNDNWAMDMQSSSTSASLGVNNMNSNNHVDRFNANGGNFLEGSHFMTNGISGFDNNFIVQDSNYNINAGLCVPTTNNTGYIAQGVFYAKPSNGQFVNNKRTSWKGSRVFGNSSYDDSQHSSIEGAPSRARFPNGNSFHNSNGSNNVNYRSNMYFNGQTINHTATNGFNKSKCYNHNRKLYRVHHSYVSDISRCAFGLMERFKSKAKLFKINLPANISNTLDTALLDKAIWDLFIANVQTEDTYYNKLRLWEKTFLHIGSLYSRFSLFLVGSTVTGLATENSDIDMCLLLRSLAADLRHEAVHCLEDIRRSLLTRDFAESVELIQAKVPILKFVGSKNGFTVDLNYNNSVGIRNTHLLSCYVQLDWRVRPLVIMVKLWAQANAINDAKLMTISSYSLVLMVIHYLQCGTSPPLLPCLHTIYPDKFTLDKGIHQIEVQEKISKYNSGSELTLGQLFQGFLHYYTNFKYDTDAISVRVGSRVAIEKCRFAISPKNDIHQWKYLCIEEPFDKTNTARSVYDLETFKRIQRVFQQSSSILWTTGDISRVLQVAENQR